MIYEILGVHWISSMKGSYGIVAVATVTGWKSYIGAAEGVSEEWDAQQIAEWGGKLHPRIACAVFPRLDPEFCEY